MNVKLLFFPLSITIALAVSIFYIKPAIDTMMNTREALSAKETFATEVKQKVQNIQSLDANLNANKESEDEVLHYLPNKQDDDRVIDGINFLSAQAGLALTSVKIEKTTEASVAADVAQEDAPVGSDIIFSKGADITAVNQTPITTIKPKSVTVLVQGIGSYESTRDTVSKLSHMDRFQNFTSVNLDRVDVSGQTAEGKSGEVPNILHASFTMNFIYLPRVNAKGNFNRPILNQSKFEFGMLQKLKQYTSAAVPLMEVGATGTANPFLRQ